MVVDLFLHHTITVEGKRVSYAEWKKYLSSDSGLFKRIPSPYYGQVVGPYMNDDGSFQGDMEATEQMLFQMHASKYQRKFYESLSKKDAIKAEQYLFTIIGAIDPWKKDIKELQKLDEYISGRHDALEKEDKLLARLEHTEPKLFQRIPELVYKHFGKDLDDLRSRFKNVTDLHQQVRELISHMMTFDGKITAYLKKLKKEKPFLFED